jgi:Fe-Mn family superoxide dismutase
MELRRAINLIEAKSGPKLEQAKLPYPRDGLAPVLTLAAVNYHYGKLYKGYVDRYNSGEGDPQFNEAGAYLHNVYFTQLMPPRNGNKPHGTSKALIERRWTSFEHFKEEFKKVAMGIQGSGWVYMDRKGDIKVIRNHAMRKDIALLIDWWEHSWALDYASNKERYLDSLWRCIDWEKINRRIYGGIK